MATADSTPSPLSEREQAPLRIATRLDELRRRLHITLAVRGIVVLGSIVAGLVLLSLGVDRLFRLSTAGRGLALAVYLGISGWAAWRLLVRPLVIALPHQILADILERHFSRLGDTLRSAVDFLREGALFDSPPQSGDAQPPDLALLLKRKVTLQAAEEIERLPRGDVIDRRAVGVTLARSGAVLVLVGLLAGYYHETFALWFRRNVLFADEPWPYRTTLVVEGFQNGEIGVPRGDPLQVRVRAEGEDPVRVTVELRYEEDTARYNLPREGEGLVFVYDHPAVSEDFTFTVEGGDFRSTSYRVRALERPRVEEIEVTLRPPEYTGQRPERVRGEIGELATPRGSSLQVAGRANKLLRRAWLDTENREIELSIDGGDKTAFSGSYGAAEGGTVTVRLEDEEKVPPDHVFQFTLHLLPDRLPVVRAQVSGLGTMITSDARMLLEIDAKDDYRIERLLLAWELVDEERNATTGEVGLADPEEASDRVETTRTWEVGTLGIEPEKRINVRVGAVDNDALDGQKTGYSGTLSFLVVTPERLGEEFIRREEEQRRVLERVIEKEKEVRDAVYRLLTESWQEEGALQGEVIEEMLGLARVERQQGRQATAIATAVEQILAEMENNRIGEADDLQRLARGIIQPLRELGEVSMPGASTLLSVVRDAEEVRERIDQGLALAAHLEQQLATLEKILSNMIRLEGFTEIVKQLRVIIKTHQESREAAQASLREQIENIFTDDDGGGIFEDVGPEETPRDGDSGGGAAPSGSSDR